MQKQLSLLILLVCMCFGLNAQVTTARIDGVITDNAGEPLIGANVVATHTPSGTQYGTTTREDGSYTLPNLRVGGPYKVIASYVGYETITLDNIFLSLAQKLPLNVQMENEAVDMEGVIVTAERNAVINNDRTGAETNISNEQLRALPTISRSASDYTRLTPSANGNSFAGRNDQYNNFSLDGSIFNNPFGLDAATPGGQTDAQPVSLDAIDQIQVSIAPYDVTQAGFTGASVNAVTKSGTNEFTGTIFGFYRNQDLTGSKVNGSDIFVPELRQFQGGFSLGGPIVKDKLFFFVNAELERREDLGANFVAQRPGDNKTNVSRVTASDMERVSNILFDRYGYVTGPFENYIHNTDNQKGIVKLDWNISNKHTLSATYNWLDASKQKPAHPTALGRRGPDATTLQFFNSGYEINNKIQSGIVELRSLFSNTLSNKLQVGFSRFEDFRNPLSDPFPVVNINQNNIRAIVAGHEPFSVSNRLDQYVFQITNNLNVYLKGHTLTFGGSLERFSFDNSFNLGVYEPFGVPYDGGTFGPGFASVDAFEAFVNSGGMDPVVDHARNLFNTNSSTEGNGYDGTPWALAETNVGQFALYAQDEWDISSNFTLTYGVRMDMPLYFDTDEKIAENIERKIFNYDPDIVWFDEAGNEVTFEHTELPSQTPLISPRVGFNWDVNGDRSTQLRGGSGLFSGRFPFVWVGNQVANPDWFFYSVTSPDFQYPQVWRTNLGIDRKFGAGWILSGDFIYTKDINAMMVRNYSVQPPTTRLNGVDDRLIYTDDDRAITDILGFPLPLVGSGYVFTNTDVGRSINASIQLQRNWTNGLYTSIAYNFLDARDATSIEAEISGDAFAANPAIGNVNQAILAPSIYGNRHRIVGAAYKKFDYGKDNKWGTTVSLFFEYAEGNRFTYTYSGDINGDGSFLNDLIYVPTDAEINAMDFSGSAPEQEAQRNALRSYIAQDDYLSERRGDYVEKYDILSPWFSRWDLRILQDYNFKVGEKTNTIQFSIDILNVGNLINSNWGVRQLPTNTQPIGVSVDPTTLTPTYSFDPNLTNTFTDDFSLLSRYQVQFGLRYIF